MNMLLTAEVNTSPVVKEHIVASAPESGQQLRGVWVFEISQPVQPKARMPWIQPRFSTSVVSEDTFTPTMLPAASGIVWISEDESFPFTAGRQAQERWWHLKRKHFANKGREQRIKNALSALEEAVVDYKMDADTVNWIALDVDAEDI